MRASGPRMTSAGAPSGYFDGMLDEVRIWNYARSGDGDRDHDTGARFRVRARGPLGMNQDFTITCTNSVSTEAPGTLINGPCG